MKDENVEILEEDGQFLQQPIDFPRLLLLHVDKISRLMTSQLVQGGLQERAVSLKQAVDVLASLLSPYKDGDFRKRDNLLKLREAKINFSYSETCGNFAVSQPDKVLIICKERLALCMELMARKNLLLKESGTERV